MTGVLLEIPVAHFGHWWTYVLYAVPVVIVLASVLSTLLRRRRGDEDRRQR